LYNVGRVAAAHRASDCSGAQRQRQDDLCHYRLHGGETRRLLSTGALAQRIHLGRLTWLALIGGGLALIGLSRCTSVGPAIVMCALLGAVIGIINAAEPPTMLPPRRLPNRKRVPAVFLSPDLLRKGRHKTRRRGTIRT
jgi:hypothetical protein